MSGSSTQILRLPLLPVGLTLGGFFAIGFLGCIVLGLVVPYVALDRPWLQLFPGFEWLAAGGVLVGLVWTQVCGWWTALVFGWLFNFFADRSA